MIPLLGGLIGATFDTVTTSSIAKIAKKIFIQSNFPEAAAEFKLIFSCFHPFVLS